MSDPIDLRAAAGDYAAGDLTPEETAEFGRLLDQEPRLQRDVAFWRSIGPVMRRPGATTAPDPGFAAGLLQRLEWERSRDRDAPRVLRFPRWLATAMAAAAALAITFGINHTRSASHHQVYLDDGGEVLPPTTQEGRPDYMRLSGVDRVTVGNSATFAPAVIGRSQLEIPDLDSDHRKPWLGVWTRPVELTANDQSIGQGHLVARVASDSPAYRVGVRPGDVIRAIDGCQVSTPKCIARRMSLAKPGDVVVIDFVRPETGEAFHVSVRLGAVYE